MRKGQKTSDETKKKMSLAASGRRFSDEHRKHLSESQRKRLPISETTRQKLSIALRGKKHPMYGKKHTQESLKKMSVVRLGKYTGTDNALWKGDDVNYMALHSWIARWKGKSDTCDNCGQSGFYGHEIQWANIDHKYRRVLEDYIRLCAKCHYTYDVERGFRKPLKGNGSNGYKKR